MRSRLKALRAYDRWKQRHATDPFEQKTRAERKRARDLLRRAAGLSADDADALSRLAPYEVCERAVAWLKAQHQEIRDRAAWLRWAVTKGRSTLPAAQKTHHKRKRRRAGR